MNANAFRDTFPEFDCDTTDAAIGFWSGIAEATVDADRWGDTYDAGVMLLTAHYLQLEKNGGGDAGVIASKAVGAVNVSFDNSTTLKNGGDYLRTSYGKRFANLARLFGAGAVQL